MPYEFLEDLATADIAFLAWGKDLSETFIAAADATMNVMVENLETIEPRETREITLGAKGLDMLLFELLQELIYYKDARRLMLRITSVEILEEGSGRYALRASGAGESLDPGRHRQRADVKAVTLHRFNLEKVGQEWHAVVILDV